MAVENVSFRIGQYAANQSRQFSLVTRGLHVFAALANLMGYITEQAARVLVRDTGTAVRDRAKRIYAHEDRFALEMHRALKPVAGIGDFGDHPFISVRSFL